jgi:hypothetical protein
MRLTKDLIQHIADAIALHIESKGMAKYGVPRAQIAAKIAEIITRNMQEEDKLNKDAEKLLSAHADEIAGGQMDYRKLLELTKQKLAKERGFVL